MASYKKLIILERNNKIVDMYMKSKMTPIDIGAAMGLSGTHIRHVLKQNGIHLQSKNNVCDYIRDEMKQGRTVTLDILKDEFGISKSWACSLLKKIREELYPPEVMEAPPKPKLKQVRFYGKRVNSAIAKLDIEGHRVSVCESRGIITVNGSLVSIGELIKRAYPDERYV